MRPNPRSCSTERDGAIGDLTAAYASFAAGGEQVTPYAITRVEDKDDHVIYEARAAADPSGNIVAYEYHGWQHNWSIIETSAELAGARMKPRRGGTDEFYGVKEFRSGENPRWIHWRRSARTGSLVTKEMTRVAPPRLLILVDTFLAQRTSDEHAVVERTIALAGSLVTRTALRIGAGATVRAAATCWPISAAFWRIAHSRLAQRSIN